MNHTVLGGELFYTDSDCIMSLKSLAPVRDVAAALAAVTENGFRKRPASPAMGDIVRVTGVGTGGWKIAQKADQTIVTQGFEVFGAIGVGMDPARLGQIYTSEPRNTRVQSTTPGTAGWICGGQYGAIELQYIENNTFSVLP